MMYVCNTAVVDTLKSMGKNKYTIIALAATPT